MKLSNRQRRRLREIERELSQDKPLRAVSELFTSPAAPRHVELADRPIGWLLGITCTVALLVGAVCAPLGATRHSETLMFAGTMCLGIAVIAATWIIAETLARNGIPATSLRGHVSRR
jgi:hypothetical protein